MLGDGSMWYGGSGVGGQAMASEAAAMATVLKVTVVRGGNGGGCA